MTTIAGFLNVVLQGLGLAGPATAIGGVAYALLVLLPFAAPSRPGNAAVGRWLTHPEGYG